MVNFWGMVGEVSATGGVREIIHRRHFLFDFKMFFFVLLFVGYFFSMSATFLYVQKKKQQLSIIFPLCTRISTLVFCQIFSNDIKQEGEGGQQEDELQPQGKEKQKKTRKGNRKSTSYAERETKPLFFCLVLIAIFNSNVTPSTRICRLSSTRLHRLCWRGCCSCDGLFDDHAKVSQNRGPHRIMFLDRHRDGAKCPLHHFCRVLLLFLIS